VTLHPHTRPIVGPSVFAHSDKTIFLSRIAAVIGGQFLRALGAIGRVAVAIVLVVVIFIAAVAFSRLSSPLSDSSSSSTSSNSGLYSTTSSTTSQLGLQLRESINSSSISAGQNLSVSLSLSNALPTVNAVPTSNTWPFQGVAVDLWGACVTEYPVEVVVISGNYTAQEVSSFANSTFAYTCAGSVQVSRVIFQPNSNEAKVTGTGPAPGLNQTLGPFRLAFNFTTSGYWDLQSLSKQQNLPLLGPGGTPPTPISFVPGTYTVAVADEWAQMQILHFYVTA
jgi:hypothetical protein